MSFEFDYTWLKNSLVMIMTLRGGDVGNWDAEEMADFAKSFSVDASSMLISWPALARFNAGLSRTAPYSQQAGWCSRRAVAGV
jgi:hypothetical protein